MVAYSNNQIMHNGNIKAQPAHLVLAHPLDLQAFPITLTLSLKVIVQAHLTQIVKIMHKRVAHRIVNRKELLAQHLVVVGLIARVKAMVGAHVDWQIIA